jgi:cell division inhibitor SepF
MASFMKKTLNYLGLVDDYDEEEEDQEFYDSPAQSGRIRQSAYPDREPAETAASFSPPPATLRAVEGERSRDVLPLTGARPGSGLVRPLPRPQAPAVHVVAPERFADAQQIGDLVKANSPVIVNLQLSERDLARRMIDFCSGVTYALSGNMEKVADQVFLLTPTNVEVSDEERERLAARGLIRA